jgi:hypothetical protein
MMVGPAGTFDDTLNQIRLSLGYFDKPTSYISVPNLVWFYEKISGLKHSVIMTAYLMISILPILIIARLKKRVDLLLIIGLHPILFSIFRGSFDHILALYICLGFIFISSNPINLSLPLFFAANFIKPSTAIIFGIVYLKHLKSFKLYLISIIFTLSIILSLQIVGNGLIENAKVFLQSLQEHAHAYYYGDGGLLFNNSIFSLQKLIIYKYCHDNECILSGVSLAINFLSLLSVFSFIVIALLFLIKKIDTKVTLVYLSLIAIFLLPVSPDYRLSLLLIPLMYIILNNNNFTNFDKRFFYFTFLIFIPKSFLIFKVGPNLNEVTLSAILNPLFVVFYIFLEVIIFLRGNNEKN